MVEIPEDVMELAEDYNESVETAVAGEGVMPVGGWRGEYFRAFARAILAERQRCADIAQKEGDGYKENGVPQAAMGAYTARRAILGV